MSKLKDMIEHIIKLSTSVKELHIFPLANEELGPTLLALQQARLGVEVTDAAKGKVMLRIWAQECELAP